MKIIVEFKINNLRYLGKSLNQHTSKIRKIKSQKVNQFNKITITVLNKAQ